MANNLKDHLKEVADAIRAKKGTTALINPQDFSAEIASIEGGGSGGGESTIEYLDVSTFPDELVKFLATYSILCRVSSNGREGVLTAATMMQNPTAYLIKYMAIDLSLELLEGKTKASIKDALIAQGFTQEDLDSIPRLTKEEFYSLE